MTERALPTITSDEPVKSETALRVLVIGSLYAAAIFFAIAFSPAIGFISLPSSADHGRIASAAEPLR